MYLFPPFEKGGVKTYNLDQPFPPFEKGGVKTYNLDQPFERLKVWLHLLKGGF